MTEISNPRPKSALEGVQPGPGQRNAPAPVAGYTRKRQTAEQGNRASVKDAAKEANREASRQRMEMLIGLRHERAEQVKRVQAQLKAQMAARRLLYKALQAGPLGVPELAKATGMPANDVLWHMAAMKKYGNVLESGMDDSDDYYIYSLVKGEQQ